MSDGRSKPAAGMHCDRAREILPRYLDGELPEGQAAALRRHLMACPPCRAAATEGRALERWFVAEDAPEVPVGFAERVAARVRVEAAPAPAAPARRFATAAASPDFAPAPLETGALRDFVLFATAVAAAALFALSVWLGLRERPSGEALMAEPLGEVLEQLEALNAAEQPGPLGR